MNEIATDEITYLDKNGKEAKKLVTVLDKKGKPKKVVLTPVDKQYNKEQLELAEQIWQKRKNYLNKPEIYTGYEKEQLKIKKRGEQDFVTYFKKLADKRKASNHDNWVSAYQYLDTFTKGKLMFSELTETFCSDFQEHLLS